MKNRYSSVILCRMLSYFFDAKVYMIHVSPDRHRRTKAATLKIVTNWEMLSLFIEALFIIYKY